MDCSRWLLVDVYTVWSATASIAKHWCALHTRLNYDAVSSRRRNVPALKTIDFLRRYAAYNTALAQSSCMWANDRASSAVMAGRIRHIARRQVGRNMHDWLRSRVRQLKGGCQAWHRVAVAEWLACQFLDQQVAGSNPGGVTFSTRNNFE